jgi:predicted acetyltransferase
MEIREVGPEGVSEALYIGRQAFMHGERTGEGWFNDPNRPETLMLGVYDEDGMQAGMGIHAFRVHLGPDVVVPMGGIGGVACLPASRGKGYTGACLKVALERMREAGQVISSLYPFSWAFYRRYGWEWVGLNRNYTVPSRILTPHVETERIRAAKAKDRPAIEACYARFAGHYRGMLARDEKKWNTVLSDSDNHHTFAYLYAPEGETEGYMVIRGGSRERVAIHDFIALTPRARMAFLGLLRRQEMQTEKFSWHAPGDDSLYHQLCHNDVETRLAPMTQGRVVDVAGALAAWRPQQQARGRVDLAVADECAPWNTGTWRIEYEGGRVDVGRTDAEPQISMDIQALSQCYYGTPTVDEVRAADRMSVHDEGGYAALRALFDGPPMWTYDGF